jgi:hypothetical protein
MHRHGRLLPLIAVGLAGLLLAAGLTGCSEGKPADEPSSSTLTTVSVPPAIDVDIIQLLPAEQVASVLGVESVTSQIYEEGTWVNYASDDRLTTADIHLNKCDREVYDATLSLYTDLAEAPNIGDTGSWSPSTRELLVYGQGYMIGIVTDKPEADDDNLLVASRDLAARLLEALASR